MSSAADLAGYVTDGKAQSILVDHEIIVEVTADQLGGLHDGSHLKRVGMWMRSEMGRQKRSLDLRGCLHLLADEEQGFAVAIALALCLVIEEATAEQIGDRRGHDRIHVVDQRCCS